MFGVLVKLVAKKLSSFLFVLIGVSLITFFLSRVMPSDPARLLAGPRASEAILSKVREYHKLDRPLLEQYCNYMRGVLRFDFGTSYSSRRPVVADLLEYLPATVELASVALMIAIIGGIFIGVVTVLKRNSLFDRLGRLVVYSSQSLPAFWLALLFQLVFYYAAGWLPFGGRLADLGAAPAKITGLTTIDSVLGGQFGLFVDAIRHLIMPAIVLGFGSLAVMARIIRNSMLDEINESYVTTARAKGVGEFQIVARHILKNALPTIITAIGLEIGYILGGSVIVESIFAWPGIGRYTAKAILSADYNAIMGVAILSAMIFYSINACVDVIVALLDPRERSDVIT